MSTEIGVKECEYTNTDIENLLNELLLFGEVREEVKRKTLRLLQWKKGQECPVDERYLRDGIEGLEKLERFNHTRHMIFRDYVGPHSERVAKLHSRSQYVFGAVFGENYSVSYGTFYASIHDILEGVSPFGDIITTIKEGLSEKSDEIIRFIEWKLAELVKILFFDPRFHSSSSDDIDQAFRDMFNKASLPSQAVSYIDKACDGFMYTFHELVAGNEHFREYFDNYIQRIRDIASGKKLPQIQPLFRLSHQEYIRYLEEYHGDYPDLMKHFGMAWHLFDVGIFLAQAQRVDDFFGKCRTQKDMEKNLLEDFGFPAYRVWKETMIDIPPLMNGKNTIRHRGLSLLTIPTTQLE